MCRKHQLLYAVTLAAVIMAFPAACFAAAIAAENVTASGGPSVTIGINLSSGPAEEVAGVQFDVVFNGAVFKLAENPGVAPGPAALTADKDVSFSVLEPGAVRVIVAGFNQNAIPDGSVAEVTLNFVSYPYDSVEVVSLRNVLLADPNGGAVTAQPQDGAVVFPVQMQAGPHEEWCLTLWLAVFAGLGALFFRRHRDVHESAPATSANRPVT